jgi:hypothetical protein
VPLGEFDVQLVGSLPQHQPNQACGGSGALVWAQGIFFSFYLFASPIYLYILFVYLIIFSDLLSLPLSSSHHPPPSTTTSIDHYAPHTYPATIHTGSKHKRPPSALLAAS